MGNRVLQKRHGFPHKFVFIDESAFHINLKRGYGWSKKGATPVDVVPTTKQRREQYLVQFRSMVLSRSLSENQTSKVKKRRLGQDQRDQSKKASTGTNTDHYIAFLISLMNELDKFPAMKGSYLIMDNAPIHVSEKIDKLVETRGYHCVYLSPYSPELNPIEQFWSLVKSKIKRTKLLQEETLTQRITEACQEVTKENLYGFISHSASCISYCLNKTPM